jgi:hypothetical protein
MVVEQRKGHPKVFCSAVGDFERVGPFLCCCVYDCLSQRMCAIVFPRIALPFLVPRGSCLTRRHRKETHGENAQHNGDAGLLDHPFVWISQEQLVTREHRKEAKRRQKAGGGASPSGSGDASDAALAGDAVEDAGGNLPRAFVHSYACLDYARLIEVAQMRIALIRRKLKEQVQDKYVALFSPSPYAGADPLTSECSLCARAVCHSVTLFPHPNVTLLTSG